MGYILHIETATKNCSVSIAYEGKTIAVKEQADVGYSHAELLHVFIENLLQEQQLTFKDLSAIAVSQGPGSYTGLRIGVSAAKGLCYALDIPLIAIDTLAVLAAQAKEEQGLIVPLIDARRMEVYSAIFNPNLERITPVKAEIITPESYSDYTETLYFVGDSSEKCKTVLQKPNFVFLEHIVYPSAREMSAFAFEKYKNKDFQDVAYFEPFYLKDFLITVSKKV